MKSKKVKLICERCGNDFYVYKWRIIIAKRKGHKTRYCSMECYSNQITKKCLNCGKNYKVNKFRNEITKYCSRKCQSEWFSKSGKYANENNYFWDGGKTKNANFIRFTRKYKDWRNTVFERDNYVCQFCGKRGGRLNADHIKPQSKFPKLRFNLDNGRTLCRTCHKNTDTWGFRLNREDIYGFKLKKPAIIEILKT